MTPDQLEEKLQQLDRRLTCLISLLEKARLIDHRELESMERELAAASDSFQEPGVAAPPASRPPSRPAAPKPAPEEAAKCCTCGKEATRVIFSNVGTWKLCDSMTCMDALTSKHETADSRLTWLQRPLPKRR